MGLSVRRIEVMLLRWQTGIQHCLALAAAGVALGTRVWCATSINYDFNLQILRWYLYGAYGCWLNPDWTERMYELGKSVDGG